MSSSDPGPISGAPSALNVYALGFDEPEKLGEVRSRAPITRKAAPLANENYVKINLKKKSYSRGKRGMTGGKYRRMEWKRKTALKENRSDSSVPTPPTKKKACFKCQGEGHWARECVGAADRLIPSSLDEELGDDAEFPTLEQAAAMAQSSQSRLTTAHTVVSLYQKLAPLDESGLDLAGDPSQVFDSLDDDFLLKACAQWEPPEEIPEAAALTGLRPLLGPEDDGTALLNETLDKFGYEDFRPGQKEAILRILRGQSTLVLLSTGSGKSLIYQLPAYLYACRERSITIVVSPLVSLMEDQVVGLPGFLKAACLHSNLTPANRTKVVEQVKEGKLHFLLISPESLAGGGGMFASIIQDLPPISFVCVDEAHCVSQWSHNFRPAYLRLCKVIREKLGVKTILGLTATAPEKTIHDIATSLSVDIESGVIRGPLLPKNLVLSVSKDTNREQALIKLLQGPRFSQCNSIIIYCTRRDECVRLATLIRTNLQDRDLENDGRKKGRTKMSFTSEAYHAGLSPFKRKTIQTNFMNGKLRIVVATVAFGMGIDKSDIRAVIHFNMPKTFESYIQEIGRAGRDGLEAHCHLFLNSQGEDMNELKRHIYSNSMDRRTIRLFLHSIFDRSKEADTLQGSPYKEVAVSVNETVELLDLPEENISTLLCYLENDAKQWVKLLNPVYSMCKIQCYRGPKQLKAIAQKSPPVAAALALARKKGQDVSNLGQFSFPVVEMAAAMGWDSGTVKRELKNLQWTYANNRYQKSGVLVEFSDLAFHFEALKGLKPEEKDSLNDFLFGRMQDQEMAELHSLNRIFRAFAAVSYSTFAEANEEVDPQRSDKLKSFIQDYFNETQVDLSAFKEAAAKKTNPLKHESQIRADIRSFVCTHSDHVWSGRAVARIFHGIGSPNFPAKQWGRVRRFWRSHLDVDFNQLCRLATQEVLSLRTGS